MVVATALAAAVAKTVTVRRGAIPAATLSYRVKRSGNGAEALLEATGLRLNDRAQRPGALLDRPGPRRSSAALRMLAGGGDFGATPSSVLAVRRPRARRLAGRDPQPLQRRRPLLFDHAGLPRLLTRATLGTYAVVQRDFGDPGSRIEQLAGGLVFLSADERFAYTFTSFAFSGLPLAIWSFASGRFVDVTARFPVQLAADATRQYRAFLANRRQGLGLGFIAAWAADEEVPARLHERARQRGQLASAGLRAGHLLQRCSRARKHGERVHRPTEALPGDDRIRALMTR